VLPPSSSDIDGAIAREIAAGDRCPITRQLIVDSWVEFQPGRPAGLINGGGGSSSRTVAQAARRSVAPAVAGSQGQLKITDMLSQSRPVALQTPIHSSSVSFLRSVPEPKPQSQPPINAAASSSTASAHPLKRSVSAPQPRRPAATAAVRPALHRYAFGHGGAVLASQSGPARLSQLERGATGLSQLSATARGKLRELVPDSQVLEEPGLPAAPAAAASRFFGGGGRRGHAALAKASSDEPRSSNRSLLTDVGDQASLRASAGSGSAGDGLFFPSYPAGKVGAGRAVGIVPSSPVDAFNDDDDAGGSDVSTRPYPALSAPSSPSPRKPHRMTMTTGAALDDVLSSPAAAAGRYDRSRSSSVGRSISDGYISSSPASAVGRTAHDSLARGRDLVGLPAGTAFEESDAGDDFGSGVGPSSDVTVVGLDLRRICASSPPSTTVAEAGAAAEQRSAQPGRLQFRPAVPVQPAGVGRHSDSSQVRSSSDDEAGGLGAVDDNDDVDDEAAVEAERERKRASLGADWRERFTLKAGPRGVKVRIAAHRAQHRHSKGS